MKRRITTVVLTATMILSLEVYLRSGRTQNTGGSRAGDTGSNQAGDTESSQTGTENVAFEQMKEAAKGTTITFCDWGGGEKLNRWLDGEFAWVMKEKHDITMERVSMDIDQILSQLTGETQAGGKGGSIDIIWINGENPRSAEENNMLYGPFTDKLPNFNDYTDGDSEDVTTNFAYPIERYEAPYGKAQLVMVADLIVTLDVPESTGALREFVEKYPGKVVCPAFPDFAGNVFMRNIIYEICGYEQLMDTRGDKETARAVVTSAMEYLREPNPYLWSRGAAFSDSSITVDNMFVDGKLVMNMTHGAHDVALNTEDGKYTDTTTAFQLGKGTIGNANFMAIAANSDNKTGAMIAVNEMMSSETQVGRYEKLRVIPVLGNEKLSGEQKVAFDRVDLGKGTTSQDEPLSKCPPEMSVQLAPIIREIRTGEAVGG